MCFLALTCRNGCRRQRYQYISTTFQQTLAASSLQNCMQTLQRSFPSSRASRILLTISPCPRPSRKRLLTRRFDGKVIESFLVALVLTLTDKGKASNTRFALTRYLRPDATSRPAHSFSRDESGLNVLCESPLQITIPLPPNHIEYPP